MLSWMALVGLACAGCTSSPEPVCDGGCTGPAARLLLRAVDPAGNPVAGGPYLTLDCGCGTFSGCTCGSPTKYICSQDHPECCGDVSCPVPPFCDGTRLAISAPGYYYSYITVRVPGSGSCGALAPDPVQLTITLTPDH